MPARRLLAAAREAQVPAVLSRDAGRYLCNYLCWRSVESGVKLAAFVHVPKVARFARPLGPQGAFFSVRPRESGGPDRKVLGSRFLLKDGASRLVRGDKRRMMVPQRRRFTAADLLRAGEKVLVALHAAVNRT